MKARILWGSLAVAISFCACDSQLTQSSGAGKVALAARFQADPTVPVTQRLEVRLARVGGAVTTIDTLYADVKGRYLALGSVSSGDSFVVTLTGYDTSASLRHWQASGSGHAGTASPQSVVLGAIDTATLLKGRSGRDYKVVSIGRQTWMAENMADSIANSLTDSSWCYDGSQDSCTKYGRLYSWNSADKICPKGWHLPSKSEWEVLASATGSAKAGTALKSTSGWLANAGTDSYGFTALPAGERFDESFQGISDEANFWSATPRNAGTAWRVNLLSSSAVLFFDDYGTQNGFSVRCLEDTTKAQ